MDGVTVTGLQITAVKGTRVQPVDEIDLGVDGARGDRRFYVVDERGQMRNGKQLGELQQVVSQYDEVTGVLRLEFPDRPAVEGVVEPGEEVATRWFSRPRTDRLAIGPWSEALSDFTGRSLRLIATPSGTDRGALGRASIISRASLDHLASVAQVDAVDGRRFRMLIEVDGLAPHGEDDWVGQRVQVGDAVVHWRGNVGRCLVTGLDPESGEPTLRTLDLLGTYRRELETTEPLPFGLHGEVIRPGRVRVGDPVIPL